MLKKKSSLLYVAITLALTACGGGDGSSVTPVTPVTPETPSAGKVVDGYLNGATVFCDSNANGVFDSREAKTTTATDGSGSFTFTPGCDATVVATGGTDAVTKFPFNGTLKAPARSPVVTPLTTLVTGTGMTSAQLATALSLSAGTDVTQLDPADGKHNSLLKTTLAVQQMVQQLSNMFAGLANSKDVPRIYSQVSTALGKSLVPGVPNVAKAMEANVAKAMEASPVILISANGTVNVEALNAAATSALTALQANPAFAGTDLSTFSAADLDAATAQIGAQAEQFSTAPDGVDLNTLASKLQDPAATPIDVHGTVNYLALQSDSLLINDTTLSYAALTAGATISTPNTIGLKFSVNGAPAIDATVPLALQLVEVGGQGRVLQLMIDKVNIKNVAGQLSIAPDTAAKVYVYGHTGNGVDLNLILNDLAFKPITVTNNTLTLNYTSMVNKVLASADNSTKTTAQKFTSISGQFKISIAVGGGLPVRNLDGVNPLPATTIGVKNTTQSVSGVGISGTLMIN